MNVQCCEIEGLKIIQPKVFHDSRGYFFESYSERNFKDITNLSEFVQDNESKSTAGVARGLHFQIPPYAQAKLVRCVQGAVLDIALDIRKGSPTYGKFKAVKLTAEEHNEFYIPRGFAHGFIVLTEEAVFQYKCDNYYAPGYEGGINILDKSIGLDLESYYENYILSDKDMRNPNLADFDSPFILGVNC